MGQIHAKTDKLSLVAVPLPDGKVRITSNSWDNALVILPYRATANSYSSRARTSEASTTRISRPSLWESPTGKLQVLAGRGRGCLAPGTGFSEPETCSHGYDVESPLHQRGVRDEGLHGLLNRGGVFAQAGFEIPKPLQCLDLSLLDPDLDHADAAAPALAKRARARG